jgi:hypothetical protein
LILKEVRISELASAVCAKKFSGATSLKYGMDPNILKSVKSGISESDGNATCEHLYNDKSQ